MLPSNDRERDQQRSVHVVVRRRRVVEEQQRADHELIRPETVSAPWLTTWASITSSAARGEQGAARPSSIGRTAKPKRARQERDRAERAGEDDARVEDLEADPRDPGEEEQRDQVRVDQRVQQAREEARVRRRRSARRPCGGRSPCRRSCGRRSCSAAPAGSARCTSITFICSACSAVEVRGLAHAPVGPRGVAAVELRRGSRSEAAASLITLRRRSVLRFGAAAVDRRRGADVGRRRHRERRRRPRPIHTPAEAARAPFGET